MVAVIAVAVLGSIMAADAVRGPRIPEPPAVETVDTEAQEAEVQRKADEEAAKERKSLREGVSRSDNVLTGALGLLNNKGNGPEDPTLLQ